MSQQTAVASLAANFGQIERQGDGRSILVAHIFSRLAALGKEHIAET